MFKTSDLNLDMAVTDETHIILKFKWVEDAKEAEGTSGFLAVYTLQPEHWDW